MGKRGLVIGVANHRSLAFGIARAARLHGAEIGLTWQGDAQRSRVLPLASELEATTFGQCDVADENALADVFARIGNEWGALDFVVHCVAHSDRNELKGRYIETSSENFVRTLLVSCHSFTAIARHAEALMGAGGSLLTLTYHGSRQWVPNYNVMGVAKAALETSVRYLAADLGRSRIRVNAISAGPVRTLAGAGIGEFGRALSWSARQSPLGRGVTQSDVGAAGVFLLSDLADAITGEILYVDAGLSIVGMPRFEEASIATDDPRQSRS